MMKMVMIAYNEAIEDEVMELLDECSIKNYTKVIKAFGRGEVSGTHLGNDIWPGLNNILYVACKDDEAKHLALKIKSVRAIIGKEGIKAFVMPLEEVT